MRIRPPLSRARSRAARRTTVGAAVALAVLALAPPARAGAKLRAGPHTTLDLGFSLHDHGLVSRDHADADQDRELAPRLLIRRARLRLDANVTEHFGARLQTDRGDGDGRLGVEYRLIDAFFVARAAAPLQLRVGLHLAPSQRQNVTGSSGLLVFDRPGLAFKALTWGTRALLQFGNRAAPGTDAGLRLAAPVRDMGATLHGDLALARELHLKYFAGAYEGVRRAGGTPVRTTGRVQLNFGDPEPGYFVSGTYFGRKRTVGIGASVDAQPRVARDEALGVVGYRLLSADLFVEQPLAGHTLTFEGGVTSLALGGATRLDADGDPTTPATDARRAEGAGAYAQVALTVGRIQPWLGYEAWQARDVAGSYDAFRFGVTHVIDLAGGIANLKLAYEHARLEIPSATLGGRSLGTLAVGLFFNY